MTAKLTLGPLLFSWPPEKWRDFYFRIADEAPLDVVCLGEVVCSKRAPFFEPVLPEVVARLEAGGKEVVHSTLALIATERDMEAVRALTAVGDFTIEANDIATVSLLRGRPHVAGPFVNVYNEETLSYLARLGTTRVCLPVELPARSISLLAGTKAAEIEILAFGRLPLAISARCFHARSRSLHRDSCQFVCEEDPDGMVVETLDGDRFLAFTGPMILSYTFCNLVRELDAMRGMGVRRFRLSPHDADMVAVAQVFRDALDGATEPAAAMHMLGDLVPGTPFSNGFYHGAEGAALCPPPGPTV
jgi:collagenase-like PrtC family protease